MWALQSGSCGHSSSPKRAVYWSATRSPKFEVSAVLGIIYHGLVQWMSAGTGIMSAEKKNSQRGVGVLPPPHGARIKLIADTLGEMYGDKCWHCGPRVTAAQC